MYVFKLDLVGLVSVIYLRKTKFKF